MNKSKSTQVIPAIPSKSVPCKYVRFHHPVPRHEHDEPVSEFKLIPDAMNKYQVQNITYTPHGVLVTSKNETVLIPLANVIYARPA